MTHSVAALNRAIRAIEAATEAAKSMTCQDAIDHLRDATHAGLTVVAEVRDELEASEFEAEPLPNDGTGRPFGW